MYHAQHATVASGRPPAANLLRNAHTSVLSLQVAARGLDISGVERERPVEQAPMAQHQWRVNTSLGGMLRTCSSRGMLIS